MTTTTKTTNPPADPVTAAESSLAEAQRRADDAHAGLENYKNQILTGGPGAVSPEDYATAGHRAEHAALELEAAQLAHASALESARQGRLAEIAERVQDIGDPAAMRAALAALTDAAVKVMNLCDDRNAAVRQATADMRHEGVPKLEPIAKTQWHPDGSVTEPYKQVTDEHGRLGWSTAVGALGGGHDAVTVDAHQVRVLDPGELIAIGLHDALQRTGKQRGVLAPDVQVTPHRGYTDDPERYLSKIL